MAAADTQLRSHRFYRRLGWRTSERIDENRNEEPILRAAVDA